jgi:flagellar export protein FliJ
MSSHQDAALRAVARVRGVREQDSRVGLQQALGEHRSHTLRAAELRRRMDTAQVFEAGPAGTFLVHRGSLDVLGAAIHAAEDAARASRTISEAAYERWRADRARLAAVELLVERRASARRAELARREARELDEVAVQRWTRRASGGEQG